MFLVLTVLGDDRPGLVESIAQVIAIYDGNWLESRMARLAGNLPASSVPVCQTPTLQRSPPPCKDLKCTVCVS